ncbi:MAG TPA: enolase C-terminal domain-like protein [Rhodocyclaceae bacterium]|nr:enolase C-terminal domain-like protein [Rhodocyclaceae bacterium]
MQLTAIRDSLLEIPFHTTFKHASAERAMTQSLWVEVQTRAGHAGYGEGCPREYVTGESVASARQFVQQYRADWLGIGDLAALRNWVMTHTSAIDANPAAWTAVELALLDALGKEAGCTVEALLGLPALAGRFAYTAVLGDASPQAFQAQLERYLKTGFATFKIKLSGELGRDLAKVAALKEAGIAASAVRADANNLWADATAAVSHVQALAYPFMALEEPLKAGDHAGLTEIADSLDCRIILDESLLRTDQLKIYAQTPQHWIANLRVSKMGGVLRSLALAKAARAAGLGLIVGAHVGETSVLTRAALLVAHHARDVLIAQEGAFGTHLLSRDVVEEPLMFGRSGLLDVDGRSFASMPGWGLTLAKLGE